MQCGELCRFNKNVLLQFCRLFYSHSYIISLHLYVTNVMNELRSNSLQNSVKDIFVEAAKFTTLQMFISLLEFIFWWLARYYPQCIIIRICKKACCMLTCWSVKYGTQYTVSVFILFIHNLLLSTFTLLFVFLVHTLLHGSSGVELLSCFLFLLYLIICVYKVKQHDCWTIFVCRYV